MSEPIDDLVACHAAANELWSKLPRTKLPRMKLLEAMRLAVTTNGNWKRDSVLLSHCRDWLTRDISGFMKGLISLELAKKLPRGKPFPKGVSGNPKGRPPKAG
jgi:hypothetical protein